MHLLDTDHMSILERTSPESVTLKRRLRTVAPDDLATSIVSYEEQMRGWLARIAQAKAVEEQLHGYQRLKQQRRNDCLVAIVDYDDRCAAEFERLRKAGVRIGTMDLKIAATTLAYNAILLTRNRRDFEKVPGLRFEDWTE